MVAPRPELPTKRPQGSKPDIGADELVTLGKVMAGQNALSEKQGELEAQLTRIENKWDSVLREHETTQRQMVQLQRQFETLIEQQRITQLLLGRLGKLGPVLLAGFELVRYAVTQYLQTHH